jgi:hypothetical protein
VHHVLKPFTVNVRPKNGAAPETEFPAHTTPFEQRTPSPEKRFTEPVALSSTVPASFPLARTTYENGINLVALRARCRGEGSGSVRDAKPLRGGKPRSLRTFSSGSTSSGRCEPADFLASSHLATMVTLSRRSTSRFSALSVLRRRTRFCLQIGMIPRCERSFGTPQAATSLSASSSGRPALRMSRATTRASYWARLIEGETPLPSASRTANDPRRNIQRRGRAHRRTRPRRGGPCRRPHPGRGTPGEVLVSGTTRDLAEGAAGLAFEPRGPHRLRDLEREHDLFGATESTS